MRSLLLLLFLFLGPGFRLAAEQPFVRNYNLADGLISSTVFCAFQDSQGFMWFGTDAGVSRFDGRQFISFSLEDGLASTIITSIFEDSQGRIWMPGANGLLSYYFDKRFYNSTTDTLLNAAESAFPFYAVNEDAAQNIWLSTEAGELIRIDPKKQVQRFSVPARELPVHPDFYFTSDDEFWIITEDRFYKFDQGAFIPLVGPQIKSGNRLAYHYISKGNALYLSDKGIERLINKNYGVIIPEKRLPFSSASTRLYYNADNDIWMSDGESKVAWFNYEKGNYSPFRSFPGEMRVLSFFNDNERNIWVGTDGNGVRRISPQYVSIQFYTRVDGLSGYRATAVTRDADSATWVGFNIGTIDRITDTGIEPFRYSHAGKSSIFRLVADSAGNIWAFTRQYIVFIRKLRTNRYAAAEVVNPGLPYGQKILGAWTQNGYACFNTLSQVCRLISPSVLKYTSLAGAPWVASDRAFTVSGRASAVFGAGAGMYILDSDSVFRLRLDREFKFPVTGTMKSLDSLIIAGTQGEGLLFFRNGKKVQQLTTFGGADLRYINNLARRDNIYLAASNNGLIRFITTGGKVSAIEHFRVGDGLLTDVVNDLYSDKDRIYLCADLGLSVLPFDFMRQMQDPPPLYVTGITANNPSPDVSDSLKFRYRNLQLVFRFTAPTFDEPDRIMFQYKVTGHLEEWQDTRFNEVELTSLDPGSYIFQLRARKHNSDWSKPQIIKFEVIAPFYGTLWFRLLVANSLILLLYLFLRDYVGRKFKRQLAVYERQQVLEKERNRISKDMHDDLGADLTNIVILSKIARKTIRPQTHQQDAIDKIETAANDVINKMNEIIWALNPSNDSLYNLVTYLHRYAKEYMELYGIQMRVQMPESIPRIMVSAAFRRNVFLVVKEMLHNVAKHSDAHSSVVDIGIDEATKKLSVDITDDGKGFSVDERTGTGNGLLNVRKRMKEIRGDIDIESKPGKGTTVRLWAPYVRI